MTSALPRVLVLGGGIAGLSAAWECHRQGVPVTVLEAQSRAGGVIQTEIAGEFVLDTGPDSFLINKPGGLTLCRELGLEQQLIGLTPPGGAAILRGETMHELPEGAFGIATRLGPFLRSRLLSPLGKFRVAVEPLVPRRRTGDDESADAFFRRRFGAEAAARIAQPLLGGIHAGDLRRLSAQAILPQLVAVERQGGSVLLSLRRQARRAAAGGAFRSFAGGMATLVDTLTAALPARTLRLGAAAHRFHPQGAGWHVHTSTGDVVVADLLILAAPAPTVAGWLRDVAPAAAVAAAGIRHASSAGILAVYRDHQIQRPFRGSGYVSTPGLATDPLMATSWLSSKWEGRAPRGFTVLRGFVGGAFDEGVLSHSDEQLTGLAHASWTRRFGVVGAPTLTRVVRWPQGSPQHEVGHGARVREIETALATLPPIAFCGSGFRALGIPDVVSDARDAMCRLLDRWRAG